MLAIGIGFLPYVVKETASLEAAAALIAVAGGLTLVVTGRSCGPAVGANCVGPLPRSARSL